MVGFIVGLIWVGLLLGDYSAVALFNKLDLIKGSARQKVFTRQRRSVEFPLGVYMLVELSTIGHDLVKPGALLAEVPFAGRVSPGFSS
jgi:hypothetical protein